MTDFRRVSKFHKLADRYVGIPLIFLPSLYRKRKGLPDKVKRICLIKTSGIGDIVLMSAVVKDMLKHFYGCKITVVTGIDNFYAAKFLIGRLSDNIDFKVADLTDFSSVFDLRHLEEFDLSIDFGQWPRFDAFISMLIKSRCRVGFNRKKQYRHYCYDITAEHRSDRHELNNFRALAEAVGVICLYDTNIDVVFKDPHVSDNSICVHMCAAGATGKHRMWSMEKWAHLLQKLDDKGYDIVFSGTYFEKDYIDAVAGFAGLKRYRTMLERHFEELVPLLRECRYVISVDTGIAHLAAASGAHLIELLGPTNPERWGARGENVTYVRPEKVDKMLDLGHEMDSDLDAMNRITVEQVLTYIIDY